jgi:hypothetical protein
MNPNILKRAKDKQRYQINKKKIRDEKLKSVKEVFEWLSKNDYLSDDLDILLEEFLNQNKDE